MSTIKDGGLHFPVPGLQHDEDFNGMTLRDAFAIAALSTISGYASEDLATWTPDNFANHAYAVADAMLTARDQEPS